MRNHRLRCREGDHALTNSRTAPECNHKVVLVVARAPFGEVTVDGWTWNVDRDSWIVQSLGAPFTFTCGFPPVPCRFALYGDDALIPLRDEPDPKTKTRRKSKPKETAS